MSDAARMAALADKNLCAKVSTEYRTINGRKIRLAHTFWKEKGPDNMNEDWHWRIIDESGEVHFNKTPLLFDSDAIKDLIAALDQVTASVARRRTSRALLSLSLLFLVLWLLSDIAIRFVAVLFFVKSNGDISFVTGAVLAAIATACVFPAVLRWLSDDTQVSTFDQQWK